MREFSNRVQRQRNSSVLLRGRPEGPEASWAPGSCLGVGVHAGAGAFRPPTSGATSPRPGRRASLGLHLLASRCPGGLRGNGLVVTSRRVNGVETRDAGKHPAGPGTVPTESCPHLNMQTSLEPL